MDTEKTTRRVCKLFWAWQDEQEERWLREMARSGWHLRTPGFLVFTFERGEPADVVYRLDYQNLVRRDRGEYLGLFSAAGWEHAAELANWHFFRTPATGEGDPEIFTDPESRIAKYKRLLTILIVLIPTLNIGMMNMLRRPPSGASARVEDAFTALTVFYVVIALLWAYAIVRLALRIRALRRKV